jgi:hypothetical protein
MYGPNREQMAAMRAAQAPAVEVEAVTAQPS